MVAELKNAKCMDMLGCGIVFTGGGSQLKGLKELAEFKTGLTVRIGYPEEKIKISNNEYKNPSFATGLGLMLLGIERNEALYGYPDFNNSYFPEEETEEEKEFEEEDGNNTDIRQVVSHPSSIHSRYYIYGCRPFGYIRLAKFSHRRF